MENSFELINERLQKIEVLLQQLLQQTQTAIEENYTDQLMATGELAMYFGVSRSTVYKMKSTLDMPFIKIGKMLLFSRKDIDNWLNNYRSKNNG
ncbi:helix-turn-helix domain-containing protein [Chryseobacterium suipulveris]|uniref:Helix-turn-helix domain-containing protein n=1 Tax=Chryseobacterium suipulveris TaxID=2929800 RepID=A0ABY4BLZ0_9FLAO|nr:helix-turn-helix domain-containing protein [Chryseobacterium suipulveris]UOE40125.1 helix-turn-helix domain-containing protein [Chryseobacterium suipulveris]